MKLLIYSITFILTAFPVHITLASQAQATHIIVEQIYLENSQASIEHHASLQSFIDGPYFDAEMGKGKLIFSVIDNRDYLNNARNIAHYLWKYLTNNATVTPPSPCGHALKGSIHEQIIRDEEGNVLRFYIDGMGDGEYDSCIGRGGPGLWSYSLQVTYNLETNSGTAVYDLNEE